MPHLIWMDMRMPVMDGYEATKRIKALPSPPIIVALTASSFEEERAHILAVGCDDFVKKPFREGEIFALLRKHLGVRFISREPEKLSTSPVSSIQDQALLQRISHLPTDLIERFRQAVDHIELDETMAAIEIIRTHDAPLADILGQLVKFYRFDILQQALEEMQGDTP
jgi:CheY-like chemotaxis protein